MRGCIVLKIFGYDIWKWLYSCGLPDEEYKKIKRQAYVSNFEVWKYLNILMLIAFSGVFAVTVFVPGLLSNSIPHLLVAGYFMVAVILFRFVLKPDSIVGQLFIYLSMIVILLMGLRLSMNNPNMMAVVFNVALVAIPMFMIDRPYFMVILLGCATAVHMICAYQTKPFIVFESDLVNCSVFCVIGIIINTFYNSIRVREFQMQNENIRQRDEDSLTGLLSKGAIEREINEKLSSGEGGVIMTVDLDDFKEINDKYGHDVGDNVLRCVGQCLRTVMGSGAVIGRFGGDEFTVFLPGENDVSAAEEMAGRLIEVIGSGVKTPNMNDQIHVSAGIAEATCDDRDYNTLFKKSDIALYKAKNAGKNTYHTFAPGESMN